MTNADLFNNLGFLLAPFLACLLLGGIHCYLGIHVLQRGVIFVDLSLAQVSALGSTLAILFGFEHHSVQSYFLALLSTLIAAAFFSFARVYEKKFPQEAIIGVTYALASAAVVLTLDRVAHGAEHIKDLLVGQILWVTWKDLGKTFLIYASVGTIIYLCRKPLLNASFSNQERKPAVDFLFYALFGIVITSSVQIAGILLVFSYLVVPAMITSVFFIQIHKRLLWGWALSFFSSLFGILLSYKYDLPAGATIVLVTTLIPVLILLFLFPFLKENSFPRS